MKVPNFLFFHLSIFLPTSSSLPPLPLDPSFPPPSFPKNELQLQYNRQLVSMRSCIIEGRKFSILPNKEKGNAGEGRGREGGREGKGEGEREEGGGVD